MRNGKMFCAFMSAVMGLLAFAGCGGGGSSSSVVTTTTAATYTIGGTVTGLTGAGLQFKDNGSDSLPVSANGAFTFSIPVASGSAFSVTVYAQPYGPVQSCVVTSGAGTANENVTSVRVSCALHPNGPGSADPTPQASGEATER
jgi:hypothetical protein